MFFAPSKSKEGLKLGPWVYSRPATISKLRSRCKTPVRDLKHPPKPQLSTQRTWMFFSPSKSRYSPNLDHGYVKDRGPYQDQDAKPPSGTSSFLNIHKAGLKENECSLHLQSKDGEPNQDPTQPNP